MNRKLKRELIEWGLLIILLIVLFTTGWYKDVAAGLQRLVLETGLRKPSPTETVKQASFNFTLVNEAGDSVPFEKFKGKTVFVNFWATWCPPCIAEMPDIHQLYKKVGKEVEFVMINLDNQSELGFDFAKRKGFTFPIYSTAGSIPSVYAISSIPTTYVIAPDGKIVIEEHGISKYDTEEFRNYLLGLSEVEMTPGNSSQGS